jgi:hypothetical protein
MLKPDLEQIAATFRRFEFEARENRSPLYERLATVVAETPELCELASHARDGQPKPNMLFAAVQFVLANHPHDPLAAFYPAISESPVPGGDPSTPFTEFCGRHRDALIALLRERMVQTNEVRRSACLLPAFSEVAKHAERPLALIEIGPSAGLNLLFDRYQYHYHGQGDVISLGDPSSPVLLESELRSESFPLRDEMPAVVSRMGIDLNPLDLRNDDDLRWLQALIWPEHDDRRALFSAAAHLARRDPPRVLAGDIFELLPAEIAAAPADAAVCLFATFVLNQFSPPMLDRLRTLLLEASQSREIWFVVMGASRFIPGLPGSGAEANLLLLHFARGSESRQLLAMCNPHGRWISWQ